MWPGGHGALQSVVLADATCAQPLQPRFWPQAPTDDIDSLHLCSLFVVASNAANFGVGTGGVEDRSGPSVSSTSWGPGSLVSSPVATCSFLSRLKGARPMLTKTWAMCGGQVGLVPRLFGGWQRHSRTIAEG